MWSRNCKPIVSTADLWQAKYGVVQQLLFLEMRASDVLLVTRVFPLVEWELSPTREEKSEKTAWSFDFLATIFKALETGSNNCWNRHHVLGFFFSFFSAILRIACVSLSVLLNLLVVATNTFLGVVHCCALLFILGVAQCCSLFVFHLAIGVFSPSFYYHGANAQKVIQCPWITPFNMYPLFQKMISCFACLLCFALVLSLISCFALLWCS